MDGETGKQEKSRGLRKKKNTLHIDTGCTKRRTEKHNLSAIRIDRTLLCVVSVNLNVFNRSCIQRCWNLNFMTAGSSWFNERITKVIPLITVCPAFCCKLLSAFLARFFLFFLEDLLSLTAPESRKLIIYIRVYL